MTEQWNVRFVSAGAGSNLRSPEVLARAGGYTRRRHLRHMATLIASSLAGVLGIGTARAQTGPIEIAQDLGDGTAQNWLVFPDGRRVPVGCRYAVATGECVAPGATEEIPAPSSAPSGRAPGGRFSFLTWWANNLNNKPFLDEAVRLFKERRPDIEIEVVGENVNGVRDKFTVAAAANDPFDLSFVDFDWGRDMYEAGLLMPLDSLIQHSPEVDDDKFVRRSLDAFRRFRGETYAIPVSTFNSLGLLINSNHFEAAGLNPKGTDIRTWQDLERIALQLTRKDGDNVIRSGYHMTPPFDYLNYLATYVNTTGATLYNDEQTRAFFTSTSAIAALEFMARLHNGVRVSMPVTMQGRPSGTAAFLAGQASITDFNHAAITTTLHPRNISPDVRYWIVPYPQGPGSRSPGTHTWANFIALSRIARNRDQAWEFLRWFAGDVELHFLRLQMMNSPSALRAFYEDPRWSEAVKNLPQLDLIPAMADLPGQVPFRRAADQKREIVPILQEAFLAQRDIRNALQQAQAIADRVLNR